jgi:hypothetical protein
MGGANAAGGPFRIHLHPEYASPSTLPLLPHRPQFIVNGDELQGPSGGQPRPPPWLSYFCRGRRLCPHPHLPQVAVSINLMNSAFKLYGRCAVQGHGIEGPKKLAARENQGVEAPVAGEVTVRIAVAAQ